MRWYIVRMRELLRVSCLVGSLAMLLSGCVATPEAQDQVDEVARVGETVITLDDLEEAWNENDPGGRLQSMMELYETRLRVLDLVVGDRLIDREAEARGLSREELLAAELPSRTLPVTDDDIDRIYEQNKNRLGERTLEEMRPEIRQTLEQQRPNQVLREYMRELRAAADDIVITLDPPRQRVDAVAGDRSKGPVDAPVLIVEFSDFECPFCQQATATITELLARYPDEIRFIYKDFPLPNHPNAFKAAEAGHCAHEQDKFWEYHDTLFATEDLGIDALKGHAEDLGLDLDSFAACLDDARHAETVTAEMATGRSYGASSTPTLFINGRPIFGAMPLSVFDEIVQQELATAARQ